jgi:molecular chaperone GrpE
MNEGHKVIFKGKKKRDSSMSENDKKQEKHGAEAGDDKARAAEEKKSRAAEDEKILAEAAEAAAGEPDENAIDPVEDLKQQVEAQNDRFLRLMAEFDNYKKRTSRDIQRIEDLANEKVIADLIEVRENFDRAIKAAGEPAGEGKAFFDGMKLIFSKFDSVLEKNGLEPFGAAGDVFDPQLHDAMMKVPNETIDEDHIVEVFEKGYHLKKRVIRHAKVIVSGGKPKQAEDNIENK